MKKIENDNKFFSQSVETGKIYSKKCRWCGGDCKIIFAKDRWTGKETNRCTNCAAHNN